MPPVRDAGTARAVHEPLGLQLPGLPAAAEKRPVVTPAVSAPVVSAPLVSAAVVRAAVVRAAVVSAAVLSAA